MHFDSSADLLWIGDHNGRVTSYCGPGMARYTAFRSHMQPVTDIVSVGKGVVTLSDEGIKVNARRGVGKATIKDDVLAGSRSFAFAAKGSQELIVGGTQGRLVRVNVDRGKVLADVEHASSGNGGAVVKMRRGGHAIAVGTTSGAVDVVDPNSMKVLKTFQAHSGPISDLDCRDHIIMTCGRSIRKAGGFVADPLVAAYDMRAMKPLPPLPFPTGAAYLRIHPKLSTSCLVVSQSGQLQLLDLMNPANVYIHHAAVSSPISGLEIAGSADYVALSDESGFVHLWSSASPAGGFTEFAYPLEFPSGGQEPLVPVGVDDYSTPLSVVGMPYYKEELLSSWSDPRFVFDTGMPAPKIEPALMAHYPQQRVFPYSGKRRYQAQKHVNVSQMRRSSLDFPRFISEKARTGAVDDDNALFADDGREDPSGIRVPRKYRKLEIRYSKFGVDDFDFDFYNKTPYSGLETQVANSYANALLQLLRFCKPVYNFAMYRLAAQCGRDTTRPYLLSELGLVFDMLHKAQGKHCRASNFSNALARHAGARQQGLAFDDGQYAEEEGTMLQRFARFLLGQLEADGEALSGSSSNGSGGGGGAGGGGDGPRFGQDIAGIGVTMVSEGLQCGREMVTRKMVFALDLPGTPASTSEHPFLDTLQTALEHQAQVQDWCDACQKYEPQAVFRVVQKLPRVLTLNVDLSNRDSDRAIWSHDNWPARRFTTSEIPNRALGGPRLRVSPAGPGREYRLLGYVAEVSSPTQSPHLISVIRMDGDEWYLFNDFLVKEIPEVEALDFSRHWKTPVTLIYEAVDDTPGWAEFDYEGWKSQMDTSLLYHDVLTAGQRNVARREYELLTEAEAPQPGTLVAIDAEFVALQHEVTEIRSDGTKSLLRPTSLSLARVSVLRGQGPREGVPFIDDYIATTDAIVDYLTEFSGIEPGDLDPVTSTRSLVTLQASYRKLWLLLNLGCVFIGHGLANDFRTINIQVPAAQVIDTVDIYYLRTHQRKLSLKFLAWYLLDAAVQTGNHDSIEDARTALQLYRKYAELKDRGLFEDTLSQLYREGHRYNFKPPVR